MKMKPFDTRLVVVSGLLVGLSLFVASGIYGGVLIYHDFFSNGQQTQRLPKNNQISLIGHTFSEVSPSLSVNTIWFYDLNTNGIYDEGDAMYSVASDGPPRFENPADLDTYALHRSLAFSDRLQGPGSMRLASSTLKHLPKDTPKATAGRSFWSKIASLGSFGGDGAWGAGVCWEGLGLGSAGDLDVAPPL